MVILVSSSPPLEPVRVPWSRPLRVQVCCDMSLSAMSLVAEGLGDPSLAAYTERDTWEKREEITARIAERMIERTKNA